MRLDSAVVAFPAWLGGSLPRGHASGVARVGLPRLRADQHGNRLIERRVAVGLTRQRVADRLGVDVDAVKRVERRPAHSRGDVRSVKLRARMNDLYLSIERGRVKS